MRSGKHRNLKTLHTAVFCLYISGFVKCCLYLMAWFPIWDLHLTWKQFSFEGGIEADK